MAVSTTTSKPDQLWSDIKKGIKNGTITTWKLSNDERYITHKSEQWGGKAWFKPTALEGELLFNIVKPKDANVTTPVYAEYHGLLTRMLLADFDKDFSYANSSAMPERGDKCS